MKKSRRITAEDRRRRILEAAGDLFLKNGYASTSLNDIIRLAGGSKATLVAQFGDKAGLFAAVLESPAVEFARNLTAPPAEPPEITLQRFGEAILRFYLLPSALLAYRGVIAAGPENPEIARAFYERAHQRIVAPVAKQLRHWHQRGVLTDVDFHAEADRFTHMLRSGIYEQRLLGAIERTRSAQISQHVNAAVRTFLRGLNHDPNGT
jgi:AcrR family transcriptional regulator